ncbi:TlpA family protein disulfide reductase [Janthinobacterium agaricidamnosum]|nr:TlpA disulfide reductase family protein [Janthinobacterium agaricidamnosum]
MSRTAGTLWFALALCPVHAAEPAMDFRLPALDGEKTAGLASIGQRAVLLNFWSSECIPCIQEMPLLNAQSKLLRNVAFVGIAVDQRQKALRFLQQRPMDYIQLLAPPHAGPLLRSFGNKINGLPYTVILNPAHRICTTRMGQVDAAWIAKALDACGGA